MILKEWHIPAKTFIVGEYAVLKGFNALVLTTTPCFVMQLQDIPKCRGMHANSPAVQWWLKYADPNYGLQFCDPYEGRGGLGASSAQFLGAFMAKHWLASIEYSLTDLLHSYKSSVWNGNGTEPSGADVLAQTARECVNVSFNPLNIDILNWPFIDLNFLLVRTGNKLRTDLHLEDLQSLECQNLGALVDATITAVKLGDSEKFLDAINAYHIALHSHGLVAAETLQLIQQIKEKIPIRAIKGCGAMGADMLFIVDTAEKIYSIKEILLTMQLEVIAEVTSIFK